MARSYSKKKDSQVVGFKVPSIFGGSPFGKSGGFGRSQSNKNQFRPPVGRVIQHKG